MALAARSGVTSRRKRTLSPATSEKIPSIITKAMKERMIRQRWQVLPRAGLFRDRVITAFLSFTSCPGHHVLPPGPLPRQWFWPWLFKSRATLFILTGGAVQWGVLPPFWADFSVHLLTLFHFLSDVDF
jgi:hypothetical protein